MKINEITDYIFEGETPTLAEQTGQWMIASARFKEFMERHRDKIRKKRRGLQNNPLGVGDLLAEIGVAYRLLQDRRITLEYEYYTAAKVRGPDFTGAFRVNLAFNIEVARLHAIGRTVVTVQSKFTNVFCAKLSQFPAGIINVLLAEFAETAPTAFGEHELAQTMARLHAHATRKDEAFFTQRGLEGVKEYQRLIPHVSAVLARLPTISSDGTPGARTLIWANPQTKHPLSADLSRALLSV